MATDPTAQTTPSSVPTKAELRTQVRAARKARRRAQREAGVDRTVEARQIATAVLTHLDSCERASAAGWGTPTATVAAFRSTPSEPDTSVLLDELLDRGVRVLVPRTRDDLALDWHELLPRDRRPTADPDAAGDASGESAPGDDGRAELPSDDDAADEGPSLGLDAIADITAMILPGIAVDSAGQRLGQGGGCYDRTQPRLRPDTCRAVLLFDDEVVESVPFAEFDRPVPAVVTPEAGWRPLGA
ncbi:5-formyltetrahydrofolate cyclo-ligase [Mobilicoccus massiliensis]|uniref:5-formyltetrahydrofolate cyclo-ligase n=1 Tax=Mobilicoccus massiliensis TaxID=1522310 RepID=UPI0006945135|nr:5-formyltetrahydrofolate cyclo-ligase [Mobilicoccus massiliensis]